MLATRLRGILCGFRVGNGRDTVVGRAAAWRQLGLGLALLQHSFAEYTSSTTNSDVRGRAKPDRATRVMSAPVHITQRFDIYSKELRAVALPGSRFFCRNKYL